MTMYRFAKLAKERNTELTDLVRKDHEMVEAVKVAIKAAESRKKLWLVLGISLIALITHFAGSILAGEGYVDDLSVFLIMATLVLVMGTGGWSALKLHSMIHTYSWINTPLKKLTLLEKALGRKIGLPAWEDKKYTESVVKYLRARALQISILQDDENRHPWEEKKSVMLRSAWETEVHTLSNMIEGVPHYASFYFSN